MTDVLKITPTDKAKCTSCGKEFEVFGSTICVEVRGYLNWCTDCFGKTLVWANKKMMDEACPH